MTIAIEQFIQNLSASRLIPAAEVASLQKAVKGSKTPPSVHDVAKLLVQNGKLTEYQAAAIGQGRPQSLILGEYVLLNILGKGGMGVVFLARHRLMDRIVALKTLPSAAIKPDTIQRFYREVKAAARLSHPNIVTAYDAGEQGGTHYLVMEYVVGRDLAAIVKENGPLPLRQAIDYMQQAARGLDYAHKHGVVHRDVKPSNLLLDQEGVVKILDMGLARLTEELIAAPEAMELSGKGQILGTIDYMSPEQAEDVRTADQRSDIYSLGCTLFYLLTRRAVYGGDTVLKRVLSHRDEPIPSVTAVRPDCPERLDAAVQWMLAKRPEDRPQSMAEIIVALEGCLSNPDAAPPLSAAEPEIPDSGEDWLEDLVHDKSSGSTAGPQAHEATRGSSAHGDLSLTPLPASKGGSSVRRSKRQLLGADAKPSAPAAGRWKISKKVIVAIVVAVIVAATATSLIFNFPKGDAIARNDSAANPEGNGALPHGPQASAAKPPTAGSVWESNWTAAKGRADRLVAERRFGNASHEYATLAASVKDQALQQRCNEAIRQIDAEAGVAFRNVEAAAREQLRQRHFVQARLTVQTAMAIFGAVPAAVEARKLLEEINQAVKSEPSPAVKTAATSKAQEPPALSAELLKQRQLDATFAKAMVEVESRVAAWDFKGAVQEAGKIHFDSPELTARLSARREQLGRMEELKDRMIATINQADPHLAKADLELRGINGELTKADAAAINATLPTGREESIAWTEVGPKALQKLLQILVRHDDPGDCLGAGLVSLVGQDAQSAQRYFDKALALGADIAPYRALLAAREFGTVRDLLDKHKYADGEALLAAMKEKYESLPWFTSNAPELDAAAKEAARGLREKDAEAVYRQAAALFRNHDLYEMKPLVERLKTQYADSAVIADPQRTPSLAEMDRAVADLGPLVRVRKDGKGDAKTIQEAVTSAAGNTTIQIEEVGPWSEQIVIPAEKRGLTICGKRGMLPVISASGAQDANSATIVVHSPQLSLERLAIVRADGEGLQGTAIAAATSSLSLRGVMVYGFAQTGRDLLARDSVFCGHVGMRASASLENILVFGGGGVNCGADAQLRHCTIMGLLHLLGTTSVVKDCIVSAIFAPNAGHTIENCDVFADVVFGDRSYSNQATPGKGCLKTPPLFVAPKIFDLKLQPTSPCRKAASDGSDMGCAFTPEVQALVKVAVDLRLQARGN